MKIRGKDKKHIIRDQSLPCDFPGCDRRFMTPQALFGHRRMIHNLRDKAIPGPELRVERVSPKDLESEVKVLKLQQDKRELEAKLPISARPEDIMSRLGLGNLTEETQTIAQKRILGIMDQGQAPSWLDKLLGSPGGIKTAVDGLRGVLDIHPKNDGGGLGILKDLKDLGFDFPGLLQRSQATKADSSFKVGPISLEGVSLTPEVLTSLITFQQAADSLNYQKAKDESFQSGMQQLLKLVQDSGVLSRIGGGIASAFEGRGPGRDISQEIKRGSEPRQQVITCESCGAENPMPAPADIFPGMILNCQGKDSMGNDCPRSWMVEDSRPKHQAQKEQVKVEPPIVEEVPCQSCGQLLSLADKVIGDVIRCSVCGKEFTVFSPGQAIPASEPLSEDEKRNQAFMRKGDL